MAVFCIVITWSQYAKGHHYLYLQLHINTCVTSHSHAHRMLLQAAALVCRLGAAHTSSEPPCFTAHES